MQLNLFLISEDKDYRETALYICRNCAGQKNALSTSDIAKYMSIPERRVCVDIFKAVRDGYYILPCSRGFYVPNESKEYCEIEGVSYEE